MTRHPVSESADTKVYRVEGFTCANCAGKFEENVKRLPGVVDAKVNFAAAKITVTGTATIAELEEAGAFERLKVRPEEEDAGSGSGTAGEKGASAFFKRHAGLFAGTALLIAGMMARLAPGDDHPAVLFLFAASILAAGHRLLLTGLGNLMRLDFDMRTLMTVAIIGAAAIGEWLEGAVVVILFALSEALERYTMERARRSIRGLMELAPREASVLRDGRELTVGTSEIAVGDTLIVRPGVKIAMDGVVESGTSAVSQAAITGESVPVPKAPGDEVYAGTLNGDGLLHVRVTRPARDSTIARIIRLVEEAQAKRAPAQAFVDRFAKVYTPAIIAAAALIAVVPPAVSGNGWLDWLYQGLAVLVVGCPCALVISTPIAIVSAIGNAAGRGVLIKGGIHLEQLGSVKAIAFDKTGTITRGEPKVTDIRIFGESHDRADILRIAAALEHRSGHPLASAVTRAARDEGIDYSDTLVDNFVSVTGRGVQGEAEGARFRIGSPEWMGDGPNGAHPDEDYDAHVRRLRGEGKTVLALAKDGEPIAVFGVMDEARPGCRDAVGRLHALGVWKTVMLTGDNRETAAAVAKQAGIADVRAGLMPEDKLEAIRSLAAECGAVAMVGDGVNDAPALAAATVGVAMGGAGTDAALETADIALMGDDLGKLPYAIRLSRKALAVIRQNIAFALVVKLAALLLVAPGRLTLWIAILSDMGATLIVALNAMLLMRVRE
jgi:Cd2+/Zn2+-exporting ATPase